MRAWPCHYCDHVSAHQSEAKRHRNTHPVETRIITCPDCGQEFRNAASAYVRHRLAIHNPAARSALFWSNVDQAGPLPILDPHLGPCWVWTASLNSKGYGNFKWPGGKYCGAHQFSWVEANGPVPDDRELDHLCLNTACVRPSHLEAVTHQENIRRANELVRVCNLCGTEWHGVHAIANHVKSTHRRKSA